MKRTLEIGSVALILVAGALLLWNSSETVNAQTELKGDAKVGKGKAALCVACHGTDGISINSLWPNLAGQQEQYLVKQIKEFRDGVRKEVTMQPFVQNLTDQDIADISAYYANLSPCP